MISSHDKAILDKITDRDIDIAMAHNNLWHFCNTLYPTFYTAERSYLVDLCDRIEKLDRKSVV